MKTAQQIPSVVACATPNKQTNKPTHHPRKLNGLERETALFPHKLDHFQNLNCCTHTHTRSLEQLSYRSEEMTETRRADCKHGRVVALISSQEEEQEQAGWLAGWLSGTRAWLPKPLVRCASEADGAEGCDWLPKGRRTDERSGVTWRASLPNAFHCDETGIT